MNNHLMMRVRVLTATDLHQSQLHFKKLAQAVSEYRPDVVALVGDVLDALQFSSKTQFTTKECAQQLAALPVEHLIFVRRNHEDFTWPEFVAAWPHEHRPFVAELLWNMLQDPPSGKENPAVRNSLKSA